MKQRYFMSNPSYSKTIEVSANKTGGKRHIIGDSIPSMLHTQLEGIRESAEVSPMNINRKEFQLISDALMKDCLLCKQSCFSLFKLTCRHSYCNPCL